MEKKYRKLRNFSFCLPKRQLPEDVERERLELSCRISLTFFDDLTKKTLSSLPTFVADCYKSIPPSSGYEVLADHMVSFLSEIAQLREEVRQLKISRNDNESMIDVKEELCDIKNALIMKESRESVGKVSSFDRPHLYSECFESKQIPKTSTVPSCGLDAQITLGKEADYHRGRKLSASDHKKASGKKVSVAHTRLFFLL